ncbi:hypothetical protein FRC05_004725 [Tulasnella sp. 425]|nr:hypothetical protein FRC05_004725 [Tulasnella sp. 425]
MAEAFSSPEISTRLIPVQAERLSSDDESISTGDGSPSNRRVYPALPHPYREGNEKVQAIRDEQGMLLLHYHGYLEIDVDVLHLDLTKLREGNEVSDRMLTFLLLQSHGVSHEAFRWRPDEVLILPCVFGSGLMALDENASPADVHSMLLRLHSQTVSYTLEQIWHSTLLLIPVRIECQNVLLAISNAQLAISRSASARRIHEVLHGHSKPDREPFAILFLNSAPFSKPRRLPKLTFLIRKYLDVLWKQLYGSDLEFIDWVDIKVPCQDIISDGGLHVVHNAEVLMRPGVTDRLRQAHQHIYQIKMKEWYSIFNPLLMRGDFYRHRKVMVVEQEAQLWQIDL